MYYQNHKTELDNLSINELDNLIDLLKSVRNEKYHAQYVELNVFSGRANIAAELKALLGRQVFYRSSGNPGGRGTNVILIEKVAEGEEISTKDHVQLVKDKLLAHYTDHFNQVEF